MFLDTDKTGNLVESFEKPKESVMYYDTLGQWIKHFLGNYITSIKLKADFQGIKFNSPEGIEEYRNELKLRGFDY